MSEEASDYSMSIYERLEELCKERGMSLYELSQRAEITSTSVYKWKKGETTISLQSIGKICDVLGITLQQFWQGVADPQLTEEQNILLEKFARLLPSDKEFVLRKIDFILEKNIRSTTAKD